jgi:hypothetical protein
MPYIHLERVWTDADEMLQLDLAASNDAQVGKQDFYAYPEQIETFARELTSFPKNIEHVVIFEYGKDPQFYCHVRISAVVLDRRGHSAFEVSFNNRLNPPLKSQCLFYMACDPAVINTFGQALLTWLGVDMKEPLQYEWNA